MLRRLRRPAALLAPLAVLTGLLAACGSDVPGDGIDYGDRLDAVTIAGEADAAPTLEWEQRMAAGDAETETLVEGEGAALADGDEVFVNYLIGNGYTRTTPVDTFGPDAAGVRLTVGAAAAEPQTLDDLVATVLGEQVAAGVTRGSRLAVTGDATALFGEFALAPALGAVDIGNEDALLMVVDVLDVEALSAPEGAQSPLPSWAPVIEFDQGVPASFDFAETPEPTRELLSATLKKGTGEVVEKGDLIVADYLGQVYDGPEPFDESFTMEPFATPIGLGAVVPGWDKELVGMSVGSRVLLQIPPADGYGNQAQGELIPARSTLYFLIDILAAV